MLKIDIYYEFVLTEMEIREEPNMFRALQIFYSSDRTQAHKEPSWPFSQHLTLLLLLYCF